MNASLLAPAAIVRLVRSRRLFAMALAGAALGSGCDKAETEAAPEKKTSAQMPDRYADGKALAREKQAWLRSWKHIDPMPECGEKKLEDHEVALCKNTVAARAKLREVEEKKRSDDEILKAAVALSDAGSKAYEMLRQHGGQWVLDNPDEYSDKAEEHEHDAHEPGEPDEPEKRPAPKPKAAPKPSPPSSASGAGPAPSAAHYANDDQKRKDPNPWAPLVRTYLGAGDLGVSRISAYLRVAPTPKRKRTVEIARAFMKNNPHSKIGYRMINDAWFLESDRDIKAELGKLRAEYAPKKHKPKK